MSLVVIVVAGETRATIDVRPEHLAAVIECDSIKPDTLRATLHATARSKTDIPRDRHELLLQEVVAALPPPSELPMARYPRAGVHLDESTARALLHPMAGLRFELRDDGTVRDLQPLLDDGAWSIAALDSVLLRTLERLGEARALGGVLFELGTRRAQIEIRLTTNPDARDAARPVMRVASPWFRAELPARLVEGNPQPRYPGAGRDAGVGDTVTYEVIVGVGGYVETENRRLVRGTWSDFVAAVDEVLPYMRFAPARVGSCPVRSLREVTFEFRSGRVIADVPLDPTRFAMAGPPFDGSRADFAASWTRTTNVPTASCSAVRDTTYGEMYASLKATGEGATVDSARLRMILHAMRPALADPSRFDQWPDTSATARSGELLAPPIRGAVAFVIDRHGSVAGFRHVEDHVPLWGMTRAILDAEVRGAFRGPLTDVPDGGLILALVMSSRPEPDGSSVPLYRYKHIRRAAYYDFQVERPAMPRPGNPAPKYPADLQMNAESGEAVVQFVIDTAGRVDLASLRWVRVSNVGFSKAVQEVLPRYRFNPAVIGGCKVPMFVQMPFNFRIATRPPRDDGPSTPRAAPVTLPNP